MRKFDLQKIKDTITGDIVSQNLAKQSNGNEQRLRNGLAVVPETDMLRLMQWMHEIFLPKVEALRGADNEEFKNFIRMRDSIVWALHILEQYNRQLLKNTKDLQLLGYYVNHCAFLETELQRYTTAELLLQNGAVEFYRGTCVAQAFNILEKEPDIKPGAPANT